MPHFSTSSYESRSQGILASHQSRSPSKHISAAASSPSVPQPTRPCQLPVLDVTDEQLSDLFARLNRLRAQCQNSKGATADLLTRAQNLQNSADEVLKRTPEALRRSSNNSSPMPLALSSSSSSMLSPTSWCSKDDASMSSPIDCASNSVTCILPDELDSSQRVASPSVETAALPHGQSHSMSKSHCRSSEAVSNIITLSSALRQARAEASPDRYKALGARPSAVKVSLQGQGSGRDQSATVASHKTSSVTSSPNLPGVKVVSISIANFSSDLAPRDYIASSPLRRPIPTKKLPTPRSEGPLSSASVQYSSAADEGVACRPEGNTSDEGSSKENNHPMPLSPRRHLERSSTKSASSPRTVAVTLSSSSASSKVTPPSITISSTTQYNKSDNDVWKLYPSSTSPLEVAGLVAQAKACVSFAAAQSNENHYSHDGHGGYSLRNNKMKRPSTSSGYRSTNAESSPLHHYTPPSLSPTLLPSLASLSSPSPCAAPSPVPSSEMPPLDLPPHKPKSPLLKGINVRRTQHAPNPNPNQRPVSARHNRRQSVEAYYHRRQSEDLKRSPSDTPPIENYEFNFKPSPGQFNNIAGADMNNVKKKNDIVGHRSDIIERLTPGRRAISGDGNSGNVNNMSSLNQVLSGVPLARVSSSPGRMRPSTAGACVARPIPRWASSNDIVTSTENSEDPDDNSSMSLRQIQNQREFERLLRKTSAMTVDTKPSLDFYTVGRVIGSGSYGRVALGTHKLSRRSVAVKIFNKMKLTDVESLKRVNQEIRIMSRLHHPGAVRLFEVIENATEIAMVMEYASGGCLYEYMKNYDTGLQEPYARKLFRQIVDSVAYFHSKNYYHRDLKLSNILLDSNGNAKICDFGLSVYKGEGKKLIKFCGSPSYIAPELILGHEYDGAMVDVWCLGIILYALLTGNVPFRADNFTVLRKKILNGRYVWPSSCSASEDAKDLVARILALDARQRPDLVSILRHRWLDPCNLTASAVRGALAMNGNGEIEPPPRGADEIEVDDSIVQLCTNFGFDQNIIIQSVKQNALNHATATYYLLKSNDPVCV